MRLSRVLAFAGLLSMVCWLFAGCGGSGGSNMMTMHPLSITTSSPLPQGTINDPYTLALNATGGSGTYTWSIVTGSLPMGLMFDSSHGLISGVPTVFGTFNFTAQVSDGANTATAMLSLYVEGALFVTCNSCAMGTNELPVGTVGSPYSAMFSATGGTTPYTWCVVESGGACDNGSGGALPLGLTITTDANNNGIISGTPMSQPALPLSITVEVRDSETIAASGTATVTLTIFSISPTTLPNAMTYIAYNQNLTALGGLGPYSWCVMETNGACDNGTGGALPAGLSLSSACTRSQRPTCAISGTPTQTGTSTFTVKVTDSENPPATATQPLTLTVVPGITNALLNGNFAIAFSGYNNGTPFILAASILADGDGNIISGKLDVNYGQGEINDPSQCRSNPNCPIPESITTQTASTYDLSAGNGLGTMTLNTLDNNNNPHTYKFSIAVSGSACTPGQPSFSACGRLIQRDPANPQTYGSGVLKIQDSSYFNLNSFFPGNFAVLLNGIDPAGNRYVAAGAIGTNPTTLVDVDCNGNGWGQLSGCPLDVNDNGSFGPNPVAGSQFSADIDSNTGRGDFVNLRFPSDPNGYCLGGTNHPNCGYAYYIINRQEMILISSDPLSKPANLTLWTAYRQKSFATGWTLQQLNGAIITELTGADNGNSDVTAGILTADGAGNAAFSGDENDGGTLSQPSAQGTYALATPSGCPHAQPDCTGQMTLSFAQDPTLNGASLYLYTGGFGYFVGSDAKGTSGVLEQQTGSPFTDASVAGALEGGTTWPAASVVTNSVAEMFADGAGNITATQYTSGQGGPGGPNQLTLTYSVDSTGRAVVKQNGNEFGVLYVIGPKKFLLLPAGSNPALSLFITGQAD